MTNQRFITKVQKGNVPAGTVGINRTVKGDKGIVLYFGLWDDSPRYEEYEHHEVEVYSN